MLVTHMGERVEDCSDYLWFLLSISFFIIWAINSIFFFRLGLYALIYLLQHSPLPQPPLQALNVDSTQVLDFLVNFFSKRQNKQLRLSWRHFFLSHLPLKKWIFLPSNILILKDWFHWKDLTTLVQIPTLIQARIKFPSPRQ